MITIVHQSGNLTRTTKEECVEEVAELLPETIFFYEDPIEYLREKLTGERHE